MINMLRNCLLLATLVLGAMFSEHAAAQNWTQVGTLSCRVDPNIGFIIIGQRNVSTRKRRVPFRRCRPNPMMARSAPSVLLSV